MHKLPAIFVGQKEMLCQLTATQAHQTIMNRGSWRYETINKLGHLLHRH